MAQVPSPQERDQASLVELESRFSVEATATELSKALASQALDRNPKSFQWLVQRGADCDFQSESGVNALMVAAAKLSVPPDLEEEERISKEFPGAKTVPWKWDEQLSQASELVFDTALSCTKQLNAKDANGFAAIHYAASRKRFDAVVRLAQKGADINAPDGNGATATMSADTTELSLLVKHGANINAADARGQTVLHRAFRLPAGPKLVRYVSVAIGLGARDSQDLRGKFASQMDGNLPFDPSPGGFSRAIEQLDQARKLIRATRPGS